MAVKLVASLMVPKEPLSVTPHKMPLALFPQPLVLDNGTHGAPVTATLETKAEPTLSPSKPPMEELLVSEVTVPLEFKLVLPQLLVALKNQNVLTFLNAMMETNVLMMNVCYNLLEFPDADGTKPSSVMTAVSVLSILVILSKDVFSLLTSSVTITPCVPTNLATQGWDVNTPN